MSRRTEIKKKSLFLFYRLVMVKIRSRESSSSKLWTTSLNTRVFYFKFVWLTLGHFLIFTIYNVY